MAQQQQNIHVAAPGFAGLNTQDSPVGMGLEFANKADNCVIDKFGRIACRRGFRYYTSNPSVLAGAPIVQSFLMRADSGQTYLLCAGGNQLWIQSQTSQELVALTLPVGYTILDDNWQFCQLNNVCYMVQALQPPLKFEPAVDDTVVSEWTELPTDLNGQTGIGFPDTITAGFGRIFCGAFDADKAKLTWSNLLDGDGYTTATDPGSDSGFYDLEEFWPFGYDESVAIRVHNDFLVVWGKESMVVYSIPDTGPIEGQLVDTIEGIGCAARDTVVPVGKDIYFLDYTGVRLLSRTIQEKSLPVGDVSINIRDDIEALLRDTAGREIRAVYDPDNAFYAVFFPEGSVSDTYVFDTRQTLENGGQRPTRWPDIPIQSASRAPDGATWFTGIGGIYLYTGYDDVQLDPADDTTVITSPINMVYETHPQVFGDPVRLKFPKQVDVTVIGGQEFDLCLDWAYDFGLDFSGFCKQIDRGTVWYYNTTDPLTEYNSVAEYTGNPALLSVEQYNVWGNGRNVRYRFTANVTASQLSFQEINIQALMGRII